MSDKDDKKVIIIGGMAGVGASTTMASLVGELCQLWVCVADSRWPIVTNGFGGMAITYLDSIWKDNIVIHDPHKNTGHPFEAFYGGNVKRHKK